jgi:hypothetical protein
VLGDALGPYFERSDIHRIEGPFLATSDTLAVPAGVGGQGKIPTDGQLISPLAVMNSPH